MYDIIQTKPRLILFDSKGTSHGEGIMLRIDD